MGICCKGVPEILLFWTILPTQGHMALGVEPEDHSPLVNLFLDQFTYHSRQFGVGFLIIIYAFWLFKFLQTKVNGADLFGAF